ncbi:hypothetical protein B9T62_14120 [Paenibacillus donghaensis]|uniref:Uncharacterized protein n=1 Tax=Paenibacillus donghaensis TaxID=414771 RepID=A0A2Z2KRX6_9BACL|nr:hypothetical protein B9T62_14120 [Paenibacillus donghaensis]
MFLYHITFFLRENVYKQELIKNDNRFRNDEYQEMLVKAHENVKNVCDPEIKRGAILYYLNYNYGFELHY